METVILSLGLILLSVLGLAAGVLMGREPVKGSCAGVACIKSTQCSACAGHDDERARP